MHKKFVKFVHISLAAAVMVSLGSTMVAASTETQTESQVQDQIDNKVEAKEAAKTVLFLNAEEGNDALAGMTEKTAVKSWDQLLKLFEKNGLGKKTVILGEKTSLTPDEMKQALALGITVVPFVPEFVETASVESAMTEDAEVTEEAASIEEALSADQTASDLASNLYAGADETKEENLVLSDVFVTPLEVSETAEENQQIMADTEETPVEENTADDTLVLAEAENVEAPSAELAVLSEISDNEAANTAADDTVELQALPGKDLVGSGTKASGTTVSAITAASSTSSNKDAATGAIKAVSVKTPDTSDQAQIPVYAVTMSAAILGAFAFSKMKLDRTRNYKKDLYRQELAQFKADCLL